MKTDEVLRLFDAEEVASGMRDDPFVGAAGGGLPEYQAGGEARVYYPGGSGPYSEVTELEREGKGSPLLMGGARRQRRRRQTKRRRRQQRGGAKRRATGRRNGSAFRLNLRAQIRLRSRSLI